jgi:mono/diheme cytochrome c family protein
MRTGCLLLLSCLWVGVGYANSVDETTGLIKDQGWQMVAAHCGGCHSLQLVTGNRGDRAIWLETIRWMQRSQNLWQIDPPSEEQILSYLAKNYPATASKRRKPLALDLLPKQ